jgi:hypothetical protein
LQLELLSGYECSLECIHDFADLLLLFGWIASGVLGNFYCGSYFILFQIFDCFSEGVIVVMELVEICF